MSRAAVSAASKAPRRKAGGRWRRVYEPQVFTVVLEEHPMVVHYTPNAFVGVFGCKFGEFKFRSQWEPAKPIPLSTTGYWWRFAPTRAIKAAGSPRDYAKGLAEAQYRDGDAGRRMFELEMADWGGKSQ